MLFCKHQKNNLKSSQVRILQYFFITYQKYLWLLFYDSRSPLIKFCLMSKFSETTRNIFWNWASYWYGAIQKVCTFWGGERGGTSKSYKSIQWERACLPRGYVCPWFLKVTFSHRFFLFLFFTSLVGKENCMTVQIFFSINVILW